MKKYQEVWLDEIRNDLRYGTLFRVCNEIVDDDTGGTDGLTMRLANEVISLLEAMETIDHPLKPVRRGFTASNTTLSTNGIATLSTDPQS